MGRQTDGICTPEGFDQSLQPSHKVENASFSEENKDYKTNCKPFFVLFCFVTVKLPEQQ